MSRLSGKFGRTLGRFLRTISGEVERRIGAGRKADDMIGQADLLGALPTEPATATALFEASKSQLETAFRVGFQEGVEDIEDAIVEFERENEEVTTSG